MGVQTCLVFHLGGRAQSISAFCMLLASFVSRHSVRRVEGKTMNNRVAKLLNNV